MCSSGISKNYFHTTKHIIWSAHKPENYWPHIHLPRYIYFISWFARNFGLQSIYLFPVLMESKNIKYFCFGFLMLVMCVSAIQSRFHVFGTPTLYGAAVSTPDPDLTKHGWFTSDFQTQYEKNLEENFGFRNDLVRLNNQVNFSLFQKACTDDVVVGKKHYLFQQGYIDAYLGRKSMSTQEMKTQLDVLQQFSDSLAARNTKLIILLAPSKASYFAEYIPGAPVKEAENNYHKILQLRNNYSLDIVDLNAWFLNKKKSTPYPLFPQQGIHWTGYGAYVAMDILVQHMEQISASPLRNYTLDTMVQAGNGNTDYDLGDLMNLIYKIPHYPTYEPKLNFDTINADKDKPKILLVGDSYYWNLERTKIITNTFADYNFWYYNKSIYPISKTKPTPVITENLTSKLKYYNYVILIQTEPCYNQIGFGIAGDYLAQLADEASYRNYVTQYVSAHLETFKKATTDETLNLFVDSLVNFKYDKIAFIIKSMQENEQWHQQMQEKATAENVAIEKKMKDDALWLFNTDFALTKKD